MYSEILVVFSALISVVGTVYSVLSILRLQIKDIVKTVTWGGLKSRDEEVLIQREQARIGVPLVVIGWIFQSLFSLIEVNTINQFCFSLVFMIFVVASEIIITRKMNENFRKNYKNERDKLINPDKK